MQQVAVRGVDLDDAKAGAGGTYGGVAKAVDHLADAGGIEGGRRRLALRERNRARRDGLPAAVGDRKPAAPTPRSVGARLAAGVRELDPGNGATRIDEPRDPRPRFRLGVVPDARVPGRDPAVAHDRGRLGEDECRAADRAAPEVDEVPVVRHPLLGGVLAHRRDHDPVPQRHGALRERREEGHRSYNACNRGLFPATVS